MIQGHWKVKAEQLPDCEKGYWYVTECEVMGVVGVCAESLDQLKEKLKPVIRQMLRLNGTPKNRVHDTAEFGIAA